jgi:hypothetical protein
MGGCWHGLSSTTLYFFLYFLSSPFEIRVNHAKIQTYPFIYGYFHLDPYSFVFKFYVLGPFIKF